MSAIDELLKNNGEYAKGFSERGLPRAPSRKVAIVACMDARLDTRAALGLENGDAHVIRNAGGVVTHDVIRSIMISQRLLDTREVMLIYHTDCGMQTFTDEELKDAIEQETGVRPPFSMGAFASLEGDLRESIARIKASPFLIYKDAVRGFVYDVGTGRLREVV